MKGAAYQPPQALWQRNFSRSVAWSLRHRQNAYRHHLDLAMEVTTGLRAQDVVGVQLHHLSASWGDLLGSFASATDEHIYHLEVNHESDKRSFPVLNNRSCYAQNQ
jgi:hypothetical protein